MSLSAYCEQSNVQEEFKSLDVGSTSVISADRIDRFITEASAEIDARVGLKYVVPINANASPLSTAILRTICAKMVAGRLMPQLKVKTGESTGAQATHGQNKNPVNELVAEARSMLSEIVKGTLFLIDATLVSKTDGLGDLNSTIGQEHTFRRDERQW
jgi:hypothetical protein